VEVFEPRVELELGDAIAEQRLDLVLLVGAGPVTERKSGQVPGQADAAGDNDVGLRAGAAQPFPAGVAQTIQVHPGSPFSAAGRVDGPPLRSALLPLLRAIAAAAPSRRAMPGASVAWPATCLRASPRGGYGGGAVAVLRETPCSRAGSPTGPRRETPYTLSRTRGRSIAQARRTAGLRDGRSASAGWPASSILAAKVIVASARTSNTGVVLSSFRRRCQSSGRSPRCRRTDISSVVPHRSVRVRRANWRPGPRLETRSSLGAQLSSSRRMRSRSWAASS